MTRESWRPFLWIAICIALFLSHYWAYSTGYELGRFLEGAPR